MIARHCLLFFLILVAGTATAQDHYRFKAEFSIKEKLEGEGSQLIMGTVYYDKYVTKVVYDVQFPEPKTYVMKDTSLYILEAGEETEVLTAPPLSEYTFFHLLLQQQLKSFGLNETNSGFELKDVERSDGMVISTYEPLEQMQEVFGNVLVSLKRQQLYGVVIMDPDKTVMNKQIFREYIDKGGLQVPTEVIYFNYLDDGRVHKKITTFKNIEINDPNEDDKYDFPASRF